MSEEGDQIMKLQRKMRVAKRNTKTFPCKRPTKKLDQVLAARGIK